MIEITVNTRRAIVGEKELITTRSAGIQVQFTFSDDWDGLAKFAIFRNGEDDESRVAMAVPTSGLVELPSENCAVDYIDEPIFAGVYGNDGLGTTIIPTIWASIGVLREGASYEGATPADPTPDMWAQILAIANEAHDIAEDCAEAEQLRAAAEELRVAAETARAAAEDGRVSAEEARVTAEDLRATAEDLRVTAENARSAAEQDRATAEAARASAETSRQQNESTRQSNETARQTAESNRASAESTRASNEQARRQAETARADAEDARAAAEAARVLAESARVAAEQARVNAENARGTAEDARASAEALRASAESARASAEAARATAESNRADTFADWTTTFNGWQSTLDGKANQSDLDALSTDVTELNRQISDLRSAVTLPLGATTDNKYVNSNNGELVTNDSYISSDYIYIGDCRKLKIKVAYKYNAGIAFYTYAKTYISGANNSDNTVDYGTLVDYEVPTNAAYLRISKNKSYETFVQKIEIDTTYENKNDYIRLDIDGRVGLDPEWVQGRIVDWNETDSPNAVRSALIALPSRNCKIKIESTRYAHQLLEYWIPGTPNKAYDISDTSEPYTVAAQFIRVVIYDTTWSSTITPASAYENVTVSIVVGEESLPSYYSQEIERVRNNVLTNSYRSGINIAFITDTHYEFNSASEHIYNGDCADRQFMAITELANSTNIDLIVHGGDLIHGATVGTDIAFNVFKRTCDILKNANCPVIFVRGNHDDNTVRNSAIPLTSVVTELDWLKRLNDTLKADIVHDSVNSSSTYFYMDFPKKKTRIVFLDCYDYPLEDDGSGNTVWKSETWNRFSDEQLSWFENEALNIDKTGWQIVVMLHGVLVSGTGETMVRNASALQTIIINHNASNPIKVTNVIYGHTHSDIYSTENGVKYFGTGAAGVYMGMRPAPTHTISYYQRPAREKFTVTEALFDIYSITPETTKRIRFGAGESQTV